MSAGPQRPWWASDGPVDGGVDRDTDPVEAHRQARRGQEAADGDPCEVCPICAGVRALQASRPDLAEHLVEAARHLAAAARSLLDAAVPDDGGSPGGAAGSPGDGPGRDERLQRIRLDEDDDGAAT